MSLIVRMEIAGNTTKFSQIKRTSRENETASFATFVGGHFRGLTCERQVFNI